MDRLYELVDEEMAQFLVDMWPQPASFHNFINLINTRLKREGIYDLIDYIYPIDTEGKFVIQTTNGHKITVDVKGVDENQIGNS